jgi:hypothetical protein
MKGGKHMEFEVFSIFGTDSVVSCDNLDDCDEEQCEACDCDDDCEDFTCDNDDPGCDSAASGGEDASDDDDD